MMQPPSQDELLEQIRASFIALHGDHGTPYALCNQCKGRETKRVPVVMTHHREDIELVCIQHYIDYCAAHGGALVDLKFIRQEKPFPMYVN